MRARPLILLASVSPLAMLIAAAARADDGYTDGYAEDKTVISVSNDHQIYNNNQNNLHGETGTDGTGEQVGGYGSAIKVTGSNTQVIISGGTISGGIGGKGGPDGHGGDGGDGSAIYVDSEAHNTSISVAAGATLTGGTGGAGGGTNGLVGAGFALQIGGTDTTLDNSGTITGGTSPSGQYFGAVGVGGAGSTIINQASGKIQGDGGWGIGIGGSNITVVNRGEISTTGGNRAIFVTASDDPVDNTTINNESSGLIKGGDGQHSPTSTNAGSALMIEDNVTGTTTINNQGTLTGGAGGTGYLGGAAIDIQSSGTTTINNQGTLNAGTTGTASGGGALPRIAIELDQAQKAVTLENDGGTINGGITTSQHGDQLIFRGGSLNGSIYGNANADATPKGAGADVSFRGGITTLTGNIGQAFGESTTVQDQTAYWGPVRSITIADGGTLAFGSDSTLHTGAFGFSNGGTLDLGTHRVHLYEYSSLGIEGSQSGPLYIKTTIDTTAGTHGYFVLTDVTGTDTTMFSNNAPVLSPTVIGSVTTGSTYIIIQDTNGRSVVTLPSVVNGGGYRWTVSTASAAADSTATDSDGIAYHNTGSSGSTTNILLTAASQNAAGTASGVNGNAVQTLARYNGNNSGLQALSQAVNDLTSDADIRKAGAQLRPESTTTTTQAAMGAVGQALNTIAARTDSVRVAASEAGSGLATGETPLGLGVWGQAFGATASQSRRADIDGYDADTVGLAFGADFRVLDPLRVGLSFAYARTNVDSTGDRSGSGQEIDSYITSLYGSYSGRGWYLDGTLTYGLHQYESSRAVTFASTSSQTLTADYSGQQLGARAEAGLPLPIGRAVLTPLVSLAYNHLSQDGYSERGGAAALTVGSSETDSLRSGLGAKASATVATVGNWEIRPNARLVWLHEFNQSAPEQTASYVAGGSSFTTPGSDIATEHVDLGIGVDLASVRDVTLSAKYDADLADRYVGHAGSLQLRAEF